MTPLQSLYEDALFRLSGLTWLEGIDLLLVLVTFYLLLSVLRRSRAGFLLRGTLALTALLLMVTIILPLPTFDWLIRVSLIAILVGTPLIFQPELRRLLERVGRSTGIGRAVRQTTAESLLSTLLQAVESLSGSRIGALIVLEGHHSLQGIVETGVHFGGRITWELLQSVFYPGTPLHDGAIILREDQLIAAGCVLPLTQRQFSSERRLGTRHRAAVGLSEIYDALVIVVSEETGEISVARNGELQRPLSKAMLREQIVNFYVPRAPVSSRLSTRQIWAEGRQWLRSHSPRLVLAQMFSNLSLVLVSLLLTLATWSFVIEQTDPSQRGRIDAIPLKIAGLPPGTVLVSSPPANISVVIQTTANIQPTLRPSSFQATIVLNGLAPGLHHLPVQVNSAADQVRILAVDPPALDLELAQVVTRTIPVSLELPDQQAISAAYRLLNSPVISPEQVEIIGASPLVEKVSRVQTSVLLANAGTSLQEMRPLRALDEAGQEVTGVTVRPDQVQVKVAIHRRLNARDVGVRVVTSGIPPDGYWLSGLTVSPSNLTLQASPDLLKKVGNFVDTLPVDVSQANGDLNVQIPLDLPPEVKAFDSEGNAVGAVSVLAQVTARSGDLVVELPIQLLNLTPALTATVNPPRVNLLLSGPLPTLNRIENNTDLIGTWVDISDLAPGESIQVSPNVLVPEGIQTQIMPPSVLVAVNEDTSYAAFNEYGSSP